MRIKYVYVLSCKFLLLDVHGLYMFWLMHNTIFISILSRVDQAPPTDLLFLSSGASILPHPSKVLKQQLYKLNPLQNWSVVHELFAERMEKLLDRRVLFLTLLFQLLHLVFGAIFYH